MNKRALMTWFAVGHLANDWPIAALWLIAPAAGHSMGLSPVEVGLLFTLFNLGGALAYIPAGRMADHVSNRGGLLVVTFWWVAIGYGLAALAPGFWSLAVLLAVAGMGNAAWHPIATGVLTRDNKDGRAKALGIHAIGGSFAEVLAPLSVGFLLSVVDWRGALAISVVPTILCGLCFLWVARSVPAIEARKANRDDLKGLIRAWRTGRGLRIVAMICLYNMALVALLSMIPLYLATVHDLKPASIGIIFAALLITGALAQPWVGAMSDRAGRSPVLVVGNGIAALFVALLAVNPPFWFVIPAMAIGVASLDAIRAAMLASAVDHSERSEGTILGLAFVLMDGVGALGAVLAGMAAGVSWQVMFALAAVFALTASILSAGSVGENAH
ncbi:MFS transporter [Roseibacterium beibuensis]|uniref:MFS transporter n=1 Tax=[Roseibacterium] beibuensis TaxID=1193142 RepID=A0ABP9LLB2_9RHOB|nr:MFS transporter [Roseibacterium beibuensis]MCS6626857.1 MFS transporter [Roseibacterium beibuensis]